MIEICVTITVLCALFGLVYPAAKIIEYKISGSKLTVREIMKKI